MHDATGVRQETGKQARVINDLVKMLQAKERGELTPAETLKEFVGHTGPQVLVGMLCGILIAVIMNLLLP
jgi:acid phosphatase family membrane protein YuiD